MDEELQAQIDELMDGTYGARRSSVTKDKWVKSAGGVWVCAYVFFPKKGLPTMYMAHYSRPDAGNSRGSLIVYQNVMTFDVWTHDDETGESDIAYAIEPRET